MCVNGPITVSGGVRAGAIEIIDEYADTLEEKLLGGEASEPASQDGS